jgi:hypothetical protein
MTNRTKPCTVAIRQGRLTKAKQYAEAAELIEADPELMDACVTLCVDAGIAAADVVCCARLGVHATGQDHREAVALLKKAEPALAKELSVLLAMKTQATYSAVPASATKHKQARRAMRRLVDAANAE